MRWAEFEMLFSLIFLMSRNVVIPKLDFSYILNRLQFFCNALMVKAFGSLSFIKLRVA